VSKPMVVDLPWEMPAPTMAPLCTMGPSMPTGSPLATENITPATWGHRHTYPALLTGGD
jgi:hypothetical protein